jgi:hypothetical protein
MTKTTTQKLIKMTLAAAFAVGVGFAGMPDAEACGGGWWPEEELIDHRVAGVAQAEKDLDAGKYDAAAGAVLRMIPHIAGYTQVNTSDPIIHRAMRVLAVATARKDGKLDVGNQIPEELQGWVGAETGEANDNLLVAVDMMKKVGEVKKNDALVESELGEAMAKLDSHRAEGKAMLETLAEKDLLASADAFKTLAALRKADGDTTGEAAALERCKQMADNAAFCGASESA